MTGLFCLFWWNTGQWKRHRAVCAFMCVCAFICAPWLIHVCLWLIHMWRDSFICVWRDSFMCNTHQWQYWYCASVWVCSFMTHSWWRHHTHTHSWGSHDSFMCVPWLIHVYSWLIDMFLYQSKKKNYITVVSSGNTGITCGTWLIHMCDMTHWYVWHDSFLCVTWLIHMCDMTHSYVWHDSFICVTWLIHMCDMTHSYVWHDSFICAAYVWYDSFIYVTWLINVWPDPFICVCRDLRHQLLTIDLWVYVYIHIYMNIYAYIHVYLNIYIHI